MIGNEKSLEDRQKEREAKYDQEMAQATIDRAVARYEKLASIPPRGQERKPRER